ncbi:MAG: DUF1501 domain-containing protein [Isosphaeraceae bacterium]
MAIGIDPEPRPSGSGKFGRIFAIVAGDLRRVVMHRHSVPISATRLSRRNWLRAGAVSLYRHKAMDVLASGECRRAFDLGREDPRVRDRYRRTLMGQGLLLGLRLLEAGVPLVQVNLRDTHKNNFCRLKGILLPPFDRSVSALIDDLERRGLWDDVLVIVTGEFGRTPRIGQPIQGVAGARPDGRDHWPGVFSLLAFGAGVGRGHILGASDRLAALPKSAPYSPADLASNVLQTLGIDPGGMLTDAFGRPFPVNSGTPIPWS